MKTVKVLLILICQVFSFVLWAPNLHINIQQYKLQKYLKEAEEIDLLEKTLENIKFQEKFVRMIYKCPSGYSTIGYGHAITSKDKFTQITESQADSLLRVDFQERFDQTDKNLPYNKRLAVAHFIFNVGIGTYLKSKLYKQIQANKPIDALIIKYCYYKSNGKLIKSNHILKARQFELTLYNYQSQFNNIKTLKYG